MSLLVVLIANYLLFVGIAIAVIACIRLEKTKKIQCAWLSALTLPLSYLVAKILGHFIYDPRPFVHSHIKPLIHHVADNGFPSDHTLLAMTLACIVYVFHRKLGILLAIFSLAIGIARIVAGVHHLLDIAGSLLIALCVTTCTYFILHKLKKV